MTDAELEGFRPDKYFARSWALLTRDKGWIKPVLLLSAALFVPIVGPLGVLGYVLEWARLTAWGVASSPKQRKIRVGECIASGWRGFVVMFVWTLCCSLVAALLACIPYLAPLVAFAWMVFSVFLGLLVMVAALRATIYQSFTAGLNPKAVWELVKRDVAGLARIFGMMAAGAGIMAGLSLVASIVMVFSILPQAISYGGYIELYGAGMSDADGMRLFFEMLTSFLGAMLVVLVVFSLVMCVIGVAVCMLSYTALGLWMRQFNLAAWGGEKDPLPEPSPQPAAPGPQAPGAYPQGPWAAQNPGQAAWGPDGASPTWAPAPTAGQDATTAPEGDSSAAPAMTQDLGLAPGAEAPPERADAPAWADDNATGPISTGDAREGEGPFQA